MKDEVEDHVKDEILEATIGPMLEELSAPSLPQIDCFGSSHTAVWHYARACAPCPHSSQ